MSWAVSINGLGWGTCDSSLFFQTEIQLVQGLGVPPERIIYANPCKQVSQIKYAASSGVQMMTFDSEIELMKVARAHPKAK